MTSLRTDLAHRLRARSTYIFGWSIKVLAVDDDRLRLITHNPSNKRQTAEQMIEVDPEEYVRVFQTKITETFLAAGLSFHSCTPYAPFKNLTDYYDLHTRP